MNILDQIKAEIERLKKDRSTPHTGKYYEGYLSAFKKMSQVLDTLQEQPVELGKEVEKYYDDIGYPESFEDFDKLARHFYALGRQSLKDKDTFDEVDDAILELVIRAVQERKDEDTGYEKHYDRLLNWLGELPNWVRCKPKVCEGLEEEMIAWHKEHFKGKRKWEETSGEYLEHSSQLDLARHFAQWQKEKDERTLRKFFNDRNQGDASFYDLLAYREGHRDGMEEQKEQMMKDGLDKIVHLEWGKKKIEVYDKELEGLKFGDKVRIVIIKEEGK